MKCFTHSADLDGATSGAIIKSKYQRCQMFGINYGDDFPWHLIQPGETVFMTDFSLPMSDMIMLSGICHLIWIDHHQSAIDDCAEEGLVFQGTQVSGDAACVLTWQHCYPNTPVPYAVKLISDWDVWRFEHEATRPFQYALRIQDTAPESPIWERLFTDKNEGFVHTLLDHGLAIMKHEKQSNKIQCRAAFETELEGLRCIAVNKLFSGSNLFESVWDENKFDVMIAFGWHRGQWKVSLRSTIVGVSELAKRYGGGGHKHAAGFSCKELPFKLGVK